MRADAGAGRGGACGGVRILQLWSHTYVYKTTERGRSEQHDGARIMELAAAAATAAGDQYIKGSVVQLSFGLHRDFLMFRI